MISADHAIPSMGGRDGAQSWPQVLHRKPLLDASCLLREHFMIFCRLVATERSQARPKQADQAPGAARNIPRSKPMGPIGEAASRWPMRVPSCRQVGGGGGNA